MDAAQTLTDMARTILDHAFHMTIVDFFSDRVEDEYGETTPIESVPSQFLDDAALSIRGAVMINLFLTKNDVFTAICHSIFNMPLHVSQVWSQYDEPTRRALVAEAFAGDQMTVH